MLSKASRVPQSGQICVLGYFLERAGTPPYCAPQSGQVRSIVALSDFICNPPAVVQRCEKNTLIKTKIAVTLKAGSHIRTARQTQRTLFVHDVHESRPAHCLARKVPYRQFDFGLVVEGWETLINIKPFLIGGFDCLDCNRDFRSHLWFNRKVSACLTTLKEQFVVLNHRSPHGLCRRTPQRHLPNVQVAAVG